MPAWKRDYPMPDVLSTKCQEEVNDALTIHSLRPSAVLPGGTVIIFFKGGEAFPGVSRLYVSLDGQEKLLQFTRIKMNDHAFSGEVPPLHHSSTELLNTTLEQQIHFERKRHYVRRVGIDAESMLELPETPHNYFCYKTLPNTIIRHTKQ